ncbi:hypothetical protein G6L37_04525 [Agrobacterium rubi]|nr:hypothetical protein [Agrobacterium rubi]NTF24618.1 hypothetical protein [Agrobacterium rubi]
MASFVTNNWDDYDHPLDYGSIAIFHRLVITAETSVVWEAITATIRTEFKKSSMLLLKPFPLEWEGEVTPENEEAFVRRQSAMKRYYRRTLGVQTIDGDPGVWMWKPILGPDPEPGRSMAVQEREKHLRAKYG